MKRKRLNQRKTTDLRGVDVNSQAYWEEVLARENLRMSRGNDARLVYVGGNKDLETVERIDASDGRVAPHKPYGELDPGRKPHLSSLTGEPL